MENYYHILVHGCQREEEEELSSLCFEHGALGVSEALSFSQKDPTNYEPETVFTPRFTMEVFFNEEPAAEFFESLKKLFGHTGIEVKKQVNKDWLEEWKKGFEAFELVSGIWVVPDWLSAPKEARKVIWMEPGMAFGTGTHETTQIVARLLGESHFLEGDQLLDVGTGSGILSILAANLGVQHCVGIDIDKESLRVALANGQKNKVSEQFEVSKKDLFQVTEKFEWVVANIIDGVLLELKEDLIKCLKPNGYLVLSGILLERWPQFKESFIEQSDLEILAFKEQGEWVGVHLRA